MISFESTINEKFQKFQKINPNKREQICHTKTSERLKLKFKRQKTIEQPAVDSVKKRLLWCAGVHPSANINHYNFVFSACPVRPFQSGVSHQ